ncbi:GNAT family N-acetyltransferase [Nocardioides aurantiacus]|uniref:Ribosomal protein S18 acetylase RimI-like enzyme n=1 Tax=Nocardioides aurantiacus TaxID=86796 RepID=A0A3N2CUB4_9ACTN|nr:GNAT family N-acetyltransferase [Nocardioides aurantiacus]ROR91056.1 ribosomal protein S18 acetylase RimI-like enzyme [Nocardioides aurantiacus]
MIRAFGWSDLSALHDLWRATGRTSLTEDELRVTLNQASSTLLVAEDGQGGIVGGVLGTFDGRRGWIHRLAVHPDHRRDGLGTALVADIERSLTSRGALRVNLLVMPANGSGLAFWQRLGYIPFPDVLCSKAMVAGETT